jgi:asparagine synthase (glutamine-hydrolysing)
MLQSFFKEGLFEEMDQRYFRLVSRIEDADSLISGDVWTPRSHARMFESYAQIFNNPSTKSYFNKMTNFDLKTLLPALLQVEDRTSMAVSLESRVPLLDHRIAELVTRMPPAMRFKGGDSKRIFRESIQSYIPPAVFERRDKMGFPVPLTEWLAGPIRDFVGDVLLGSRARQRGLYQMDGVEKLLAKNASFGRPLWGLLSLELWYQAFVDGDRLPAKRERRVAAEVI